jgi:hypothetical protein
MISPELALVNIFIHQGERFENTGSVSHSPSLPL